MTNSATSTSARRPAPVPDPGRGGTAGFQSWQFFALASLVGATAAVMVSPQGTHPLALLLISAAAMAAGLVGAVLSRAIYGFFSGGVEALPLPPASRDVLEREKSLVLRSIKELEFDKGMGKVSDADFADIMGRLRARALTLMRDLERTPAAEPSRQAEPMAAGSICPACRTANDADARFCKKCGAKLGDAA